MQRTDFRYDLPEPLIAQTPLPSRDASRLLRLGRDGTIAHAQFSDVVELLRPGDLLVVNDTLVVKARLRGRKDSGGSAEILVERWFAEDDRRALCQVRVSKPLKPGRKISVAGAAVSVLGRRGEFYELEFPEPVPRFIERFGEVPLPPYIRRDGAGGATADAARYQTVYGAHPGAVAAPTAGLHFSDVLLERLSARGVNRCAVTLHVGAGTFRPVRCDDLAEHKMHRERFHVSAEAAEAIRATCDSGGRIVAVGTTVVRTLESCVAESGDVEPGMGETELFITPGFRFRAVDALITNFHLPESTLLMLVCAFAGFDPVMSAYREAVDHGYRFFSYGDAMFCERHDV